MSDNFKPRRAKFGTVRAENRAAGYVFGLGRRLLPVASILYLAAARFGAVMASSGLAVGGSVALGVVVYSLCLSGFGALGVVVCGFALGGGPGGVAFATARALAALAVA